MSLDDLLGLLFLLVFIVGPALKGLLRGNGEIPAPLEPESPEPSPEEPKPALPDSTPTRVEAPREQTRVRPVRIAEPTAPAASEPPVKTAEAKPLRLRFDRGGILEGVVWHEILSEPRARRRWKPKR